jgi:hypothetical protein
VIPTPTPLPDDIETLKQLLVNRDALIAKLFAEIARLKRWQFGHSSERLDATLTQLQSILADLVYAPQRFPTLRRGIIAVRGDAMIDGGVTVRRAAVSKRRRGRLPAPPTRARDRRQRLRRSRRVRPRWMRLLWRVTLRSA